MNFTLLYAGYFCAPRQVFLSFGWDVLKGLGNTLILLGLAFQI